MMESGNVVREEHGEAPATAAQLHERQAFSGFVFIGPREALDASFQLLKRGPGLDELLLTSGVSPPVVEPDVVPQGVAQRRRREGAEVWVGDFALERVVQRSLLARGRVRSVETLLHAPPRPRVWCRHHPPSSSRFPSKISETPV